MDTRLHVTPLANLPYPEQLQRKYNDAKRLAFSLLKQFVGANVAASKTIKTENILEPVCLIFELFTELE